MNSLFFFGVSFTAESIANPAETGDVNEALLYVFKKTKNRHDWSGAALWKVK